MKDTAGAVTGAGFKLFFFLLGSIHFFSPPLPGDIWFGVAFPSYLSSFTFLSFFPIFHTNLHHTTTSLHIPERKIHGCWSGKNPCATVKEISIKSIFFFLWFVLELMRETFIFPYWVNCCNISLASVHRKFATAKPFAATISHSFSLGFIVTRWWYLRVSMMPLWEMAFSVKYPLTSAATSG